MTPGTTTIPGISPATGTPPTAENPTIPENPTSTEVPISTAPCEELNQGCIIVRTYAGDKMIPLEGTAVAVYKAGIRKKELVSLQTTDETGSTPIITVEAAEIHLSELPGMNAPHATYFVNAWAPHYYPTVDREVDVFSGAASVLEIEMEPLPEEKPGMPMEVKTSG
jgi:hypothetical protein